MLLGAKVLETLGLSDEDIRTAAILFQQIPSPPPLQNKHRNTAKQTPRCSFTKAEIVMGYTTRQLQRAKALRVLGTSEDDIEIENSKYLGALGHSGRRRSFIVHHELRKNHGEPAILMSKCMRNV
jgi:hypothetical protein